MSRIHSTQSGPSGPDGREFRQALAELGLDAGPDQAEHAESLARYVALLTRWNTRINLVGFKTWQDILFNLVADSFHLARWLTELPIPEDPLCLDLGDPSGRK